MRPRTPASSHASRLADSALPKGLSTWPLGSAQLFERRDVTRRIWPGLLVETARTPTANTGFPVFFPFNLGKLISKEKPAWLIRTDEAGQNMQTRSRAHILRNYAGQT
jgi:hypothetical protein